MKGVIDNPDQRICEDVQEFTKQATELGETLLTGILSVFAFSGVLYSISPTLFFVLITYCAAGTLVTSAGFGPAMVRVHPSSLDCNAVTLTLNLVGGSLAVRIFAKRSRFPVCNGERKHVLIT